MSFGYLTGSVSASPGLSASGKTCTDSYTSATGKTSVSGQYSGTACKSTSYLATWISDYSVTGKLRINGTTWTSKLLDVYCERMSRVGSVAQSEIRARLSDAIPGSIMAPGRAGFVGSPGPVF